MTLGYLVWWRVVDTHMDTDTAQAIADKLGVKPPSRPSPVDVFRKLSGTTSRTRKVIRDRVKASEVTDLELHPVESQKTMRVRHIVAHTSRHSSRAGGQVPISHERVGEVVFYKPPRDKPSKARVRVTMDDPNDEWLTEYADQLRAEYQHGLTALDAQGVRRLVRSYLTKVDALYIDGVYFLREAEHADQLEWLFDQLGEDCRCHRIDLADGIRARGVVANGLEQAVADGGKLDLLEAFIPLGVVPDRLWQRLETES